MNTTLPPGPIRTPGGFGIDPRLGAAALRAPAASKEDSRPHAILKFQPRNCFDCRVCYEPQLSNESNVCSFFQLKHNAVIVSVRPRSNA